MSKNAQNRPQRKVKDRKKVVVHKHNFEGGVHELLDRHKQFVEQWAEKFNLRGTQFDEFKQAVIMQFGHTEANDRVFAQSLDKIDTNVLAFAKVLRAIYGQLEQIDEFLKIILDKLDLKAEELPINLDDIRDRAEAMTRMAIATAFNEVFEEKKAHEQAQIAAEKMAREQAKKDQEEAKVAEEALREAEAPQLDPLAGGRGADIPEGAQVFGDD